MVEMMTEFSERKIVINSPPVLLKLFKESLNNIYLETTRFKMLVSIVVVSLLLPHFSVSYFQPCELVECYLFPKILSAKNHYNSEVTFLLNNFFLNIYYNDYDYLK